MSWRALALAGQWADSNDRREYQPGAEQGHRTERSTCGSRLSGHSDSSDIRSTIRVQSTGDPVRHRHHVVSMRADGIRRLESPEAYESVPRRTLSRDGRIRPWTPSALRRGTGPAALAGCSCT